MKTTFRQWMVVMAGCALLGCARSPSPGRASGPINDHQITARIVAAYQLVLAENPMRMQVETSQGVVQLTGLVTSPNTAQLAVEIARQMPGVERVEATIFVISANDADEPGPEPAERRPDEDTTRL